jgi:predicted ATPase
MDFDQPPVLRVTVDEDRPLPEDRWPATIPAVAQILRNGLELSRGITFLVGENGSGKSTIVEAVAMAYGLGREGGSTGSRHGTRSSESPLSHSLRLQRGLGAGRWGFFLRAGFYCLDEPEAALSFTSTLSLISTLLDLARSGGQVLCATHSPVLAALPGATLLEVGEWGLRKTTWEDMDLVWHWRRFLTSPEAYLRHLRSD